MSGLREVFKHSAIYAVGHALQSVVGLILLPFYTSYLTRADYGVIQILDFGMALTAIFVGMAFFSAATRYSFDPDYADDKHSVWTTSLTCVTVLTVIGVVPLLLSSELVGSLLLGDSIEHRGRFVRITLCTLLLRVPVETCLGYVRAQKRSVLFAIYTIFSLVLSVGLSVWFIKYRGWGVEGLLWSNFGNALFGLVVLGLTLFLGKPFRFRRELVGGLLAFVWPLSVNNFLMLSMHQSSVFLLRVIIGDMGTVGLFALALKLVQGAYQLIILPFEWIWSVEVYELDRQPDRLALFRRLFRYYVAGMALLFGSLAVFGRVVVYHMADEEFFDAAGFIPALALAFFLLSLHPFFRTPALVHKRTTSIAATAATAAAVCAISNLVLIPTIGVHGATFALVLTYATFSAAGQMRYRRIEDLGFPIRWVLACGGGAIAAFIAFHSLFFWIDSIRVEECVLGAYLAVLALLVVLGIRRFRARRGRSALPAPARADRVGAAR